jgi:hypothetical protein
VYDGQIEGRRKELPVYLVRRPEEDPDEETATFYQRLLPMLSEPAIACGDSPVLNLASNTVIGIERRSPDSRTMLCLVNLGEANAEIAFATDALAHVRDCQDLRIISTELQRSPQLDLWPGGITVRLRGHEGLLFAAR